MLSTYEQRLGPKIFLKCGSLMGNTDYPNRIGQGIQKSTQFLQSKMEQKECNQNYNMERNFSFYLHHLLESSQKVDRNPDIPLESRNKSTEFVSFTTLALLATCYQQFSWLIFTPIDSRSYKDPSNTISLLYSTQIYFESGR